ncbi:RICIN domain-containing protein [Kineosporia babensis]
MLVVVIGLGVFTSTSAQAAGPWGPYLLIDKASGHCIDNPNSSTGNDTTMIIYTCSGNNNQRWLNSTPVTSTDYWTYNAASGKCLTVKAGATTNNAAIIQYTCNTGTNERWKYESTTCNCVNGTITVGGRQYAFVGYFKIKNLKSGRCITVKNASRASGSPLLQYDCSSPGSNVFMQYRPL